MVEITRSMRLAEAAFALRLLDGLDAYYPDFNHWYINQVMPGIILGEDVLVCAKNRGRLIGVALGKKRAGEVKLRCVRVVPAYQNKSVGLRLVDRMLMELGEDKPHCTVAEEMLHQFSRPFINYYGFSLDAVDKGMYRAGKLEYVFNAPNVISETVLIEESYSYPKPAAPNHFEEVSIAHLLGLGHKNNDVDDVV